MTPATALLGRHAIRARYLVAASLLAAAALVAAAPAAADDDPVLDSPAEIAALESCSSGVRTLSNFGDRVYPDQGNGGYASVHTDLHIVYDTAANLFLPGNHADLTIQATQCLSDFSFDFERTAMSGSAAGPNMTVGSVLVNGAPAAFDFRQPTYPGNPNGPDDPNPQAHAISNVNPVSAANPLPPACSPQVSGNSQNGLQCPANKLVVTPASPIPVGETLVVTINWTGRPGVHADGDGSTEGWFRVNTAAAPNDGGFVTTEPVGNMAWMPLNNHPTAKPTYDVYDTVPVGKTAIGPGELVGSTPGPTLGPLGPTSVNAPDANFPAGSWTWQWHSPEPIASYLVGNSIGSYDLLARTSASGVQYFQAQASAISASRKAINKIAMDNHEDLTTFQELFNGPFPFTTDGVIVGIPSAGFEEEMQTKITFANSQIGGASGTTLGTFAHENMHQWFGDNVAEAGFRLTFWKEGWATVGEYLLTARTAANAAGGLGTPAGNTAFDNSLTARFNTNYGTTSGTAWTSAPSNPTVGNLFTTVSTYTRPGTTYLALRQILGASASRPGSDRWIGAMKQIQDDFGGGSITEAQLEDVFHQWLPNQSAGCHAKLDQFFAQWFDTAYPSPNNATNKPQITGPGLNGPDKFYDDAGACPRADQTIVFGPLADRTFGDADFSVSATASSGLAVSFAAGGQCTVAGTLVHLTGGGACTITASQAGDGVFKPAPSVEQTFAIARADQTIAFGALADRTYGDADFAVSATASSGLAVSFAAAGDCTVAGALVHLTGAGSCAITASQAGNDDYNPAPDVARTFAIGKATLQVTPSPLSASRQYSDPNPAFVPAYTGFVGDDDDESSVGTPPTCAAAATASSPPGVYGVSCSGGEARDYDFAFSAGSLTVTVEDADATYVGDMLAFTPPGGSSASVALRAVVRDSSAIPGSGDADPGDIRNATLTFREGAATLCGSLSVSLLEADPAVGSAFCSRTLALGAHTVDLAVGGFYAGAGQTLVEVAEPDGSFVTGGGFRVLSASAGRYRADPGSRMSFAFNVKYGKNMTNLKGHASLTFAAGGRAYEIKSTAMDSLGIALKRPTGGACAGPPSATCFGIGDLRSKANLTDVTNPASPVGIAGNLTLQLTLTDRGEPGSADTIGVTLWNGATLLFSSEWSGAKTLEGPLAGGNTVVH